MQTTGNPGLIAAAPDALASSLRDVPWQWRDVLIGFLPPVLAMNAHWIAGPSLSASFPRYLWAPMTLLLMAWMYAYPLVVARRRILSLPTARTVLVEFLIALLAVPVVTLATNGIAIAMARYLGISSRASSAFEPIAGSSDRFDWVPLLIFSILVAPVAEEVFFRGMFFNALRRRLRPISAAAIQAAVFALMHPLELAGRTQVAAMGFFLAMLYQWRKRLLAPIFLHALTNAAGMAVLFGTVAAAANAPILGVRGEAHEKGCLVTEVIPGSAAESAGLKIGDVIQAAGENSVRNPEDLVLIVRTKTAGVKLPVWYLRDGSPSYVEAELKARPARSTP